MSDIKVALVGAPRSGNRLIQRMLQRHGFVAEVRHYGMLKAFRNGGDIPALAIMPIRARHPHWLSCDRDWALLPKPGGWCGLYDVESVERLIAVHFEMTLRWLAEFSVPLLPVCYEEIVTVPETVGADIVAFVARPGTPGWTGFKGWGEAIVDGNAKWNPRPMQSCSECLAMSAPDAPGELTRHEPTCSKAKPPLGDPSGPEIFDPKERGEIVS